MALQVSGREVLHASAVRSPAGVTALCADSETGKSTIAFGLSSRGYPVWADDLVAIEVSDQGGVAISLPFTMRLRPPSAALFKQTDSVPVDEHVSPGAENSPLAAICVLQRKHPYLTSFCAFHLVKLWRQCCHACIFAPGCERKRQ